MWPVFNLEEQYAEHPTIKREEVQKLHQWLKAQPHLPDLLEQEALLFYYACDHEMERAKHVIDKHYTFRTLAVDFFGNLDLESPKLVQAQKTMASFPLNESTPKGYRVTITKLTETDAAKYDFVDSLKLFFAAQDIWLHEVGLVPGIIIVIDLAGFSFRHLTRIGISHVKKICRYAQEVVPVPLLEMHFVNPSSIVGKIMKLLKPLIKKESKNKVVVHSSLESLHQHIPPCMLPQEYGGDERSCAELAEIYYKKVRKYRLNIIEFNRSRHVDEKLRPSKNESDLVTSKKTFDIVNYLPK
uniref:CRAL-TRIO domain-containing protein n=1 Tax=Stomoxys calcitrans TaxID=35570 RepID=A0A1I8PLV1_STOCA